MEADLVGEYILMGIEAFGKKLSSMTKKSFIIKRFYINKNEFYTYVNFLMLIWCFIWVADY